MLYIFDEMDKIDDDFLGSLAALLSKERNAKLKRLQSPQGKKASALAYLLLRFALSDIYEINEAARFDYLEKGKPVLRDYPHIHFNLSHSKNAVACAVSDVPVGVDVQHVAPIADKVAKRVLTASEYAKFKDSLTPDEYFCELWTIKESFLKQMGIGIATDLRNIEAENIKNKMIFKGSDYFCCVCGPKMQIKHVRRKEIEQLCKSN